MIAASLQHAGHRVLRADTAEDAVRLVNETLPDVVLLDWMLPGMSGIQYARRLPQARGVWENAFAGLYRRVRIQAGQQQTLAETLARFVQAFQALPDGVIAFDRCQHFDWINERAARHFALSAETDRGQALTNLVRHPEFVTYINRGNFAEPLIYRGGRVDGLTLLLQIIPYWRRAAAPVAPDRALLPRRSWWLARNRRHRPRPGDRQACPDTASGNAGDRK